MVRQVGGERWLEIATTPETNPGVFVEPSQVIRVTGGGLNPQGQRQTFSTEEHANTATQPADTFSHFEPGGSMEMIASPYDSAAGFGDPLEGPIIEKSAMRFLLDAVTVRTSGVLKSYSMHSVLNDVHTEQYSGMKLNRLGIGWSEGDPRIRTTTEWVGQYYGLRSTAYGTGDATTFPAERYWIAANASVELGDKQGRTAVFTQSDNSLRAMQIDVGNNITAGPVGRYYPASAVTANESVRNGLSETIEGDHEITGSFVIAAESDTWIKKYVNDQKGEIRVFSFHPDGAMLTTTADTTTNPALDTAVFSVNTDPTTDHAIGDVVYIEDHTNADPELWPREVLYVAAVGSAPDEVTVDTDGSDIDASQGRNTTFAFANSATNIFEHGMQLLLPEIVVEDYQILGGARDQVTAQINFRAQIKPVETKPLIYLVR